MKTVKYLLSVFCLLLSVAGHAQESNPGGFKVIAFDAFPIFDPRPVAQAAEAAFPGQGQKVMEVWRSRLFEYQWLRALGGQYEDFMAAAESSLIFTARQLNQELTDQKKQQLLGEFMNLKMWPDAPDAIRALKSQGLELVFLSNMTEQMLRNGLKNAGMEKEFSHIFSTDAAASFKPDPKAYALAVDKLGVPKEKILFVAFAGWDAAGAKWYGYPTFWVNRQGAPAEELGAMPDATSKDLQGLVDYITPVLGKD